MTETETKTKTETVTKIKTETETKIEPMAETETDTETETETKTEIETKTETTGETETREGEGAVTSPRSSQTLHSTVCPLAASRFYNTLQLSDPLTLAEPTSPASRLRRYFLKVKQFHDYNRKWWNKMDLEQKQSEITCPIQIDD